MRRRFMIVDVFSDRPLGGNPLAVVLDADGLDTAVMQRIAEWTNLSETTFCLSASDSIADYQLRIFTPRSELPFAGHPTLGSLYALRNAGVIGEKSSYVQQCAAGLIRLEHDSDGYRFRLPAARVELVDDQNSVELHAALGIAPGTLLLRLIDVGPRWIVGRLDTRAALRRLRPDLSVLAALEQRLQATGVTLYADDSVGGEAAVEVRSFAPSQGVPEDPVCGSGNGAVAIYRRDHEALPPGTIYLARQGFNVGRDGQLRVKLASDAEVWVGGRCHITVEGILDCD
jgi:PhzF family phenazine biosynthesis protein